MLAGADDNRVEFLLLVKKFSEVSLFAGLGIFLGSSVQIVFVDIAQGNNVFRCKLAGIVLTTTARTDDRDIKFFIQIASAQDVWRRNSRGCSDGGAGLQKRSAIEMLTGHDSFLT